MLKRLQERINQQYGSKRGWLNHQNARIAGAAGRWRTLERIDWHAVERLVFICMGNICRSPLAEAVVKADHFPTCSAGLNCTPGMPADPRALQYAANQGLDLGAHRTTLLTETLLRPGDLIVGMEPQHLIMAQDRLGNLPIQKTLLGLWNSQPRPYLHDPYMAGEIYFQICGKYIVESVQNMIALRLDVPKERG